MKKRKGILGAVLAGFALIACACRNAFSAGAPLASANTYEAATQVYERSVSRTNDAAVTARHLLWKQGATDAGVALCGAADLPLGTIDNTESSTGIIQEVKLLGRGPTKKFVASEAITAGEELFTAANGKVQDRPSTSGTYWLVGIALTAAGADGDLVEANDCVPVKLVIA